MVKKESLNSLIEKIENIPAVKNLPPKIKAVLEAQLKSLDKILIPIITFKENDWIIATTPIPILNLAAQGKTEIEAVENLKAMITDYMSDPDTLKPKIDRIINMQIGIKNIPMKLPLIEGSSDNNLRQNTRENSSITT